MTLDFAFNIVQSL